MRFCHGVEQVPAPITFVGSPFFCSCACVQKTHAWNHSDFFRAIPHRLHQWHELRKWKRNILIAVMIKAVLRDFYRDYYFLCLSFVLMPFDSDTNESRCHFVDRVYLLLWFVNGGWMELNAFVMHKVTNILMEMICCTIHSCNGNSRINN